MRMTKMTRLRVVVALGGLLSIGACGDDSGSEGGSSGGDNGGQQTGDGGMNGGGGPESFVPAEPYTLSYTLVPILATDDTTPIVDPHEVEVLDAATGKPLKPPITGKTGKGTGKIKLENIPGGKLVNLYIRGVGPADDPSSTYDTIALNVNPISGDPLLRISQGGTLTLAEQSSGFTADPERASMAMVIYWSPKGVRRGTVGCAKVCIDGEKEPIEDMAQRYTAANGVPTTLENASETNLSGRVYLGNATVGSHTLGVSFDDCKTLIQELDFHVPFARQDASGPIKAVLMQLAIDLDTESNPTPADCDP